MNSSKKLSNPPSPSKRSAEVGQFVALNQQEFAELLTFIDFAEGFTIGFFEVNFPPDADLLIEALEKNPECQEIQFVTLDFSDPNLRFLRDGIVKILPTIQREPDKKLVLIVRGLAEEIGVFGDYPPVLQDLNFVRDSYKKTVPHPILFILPDYAIPRLAKFAPDFWAWRSGLFRFKTPQVTQDYAIERTLNSKEAIDEIPTPEKQERIDLLQRLLMEYNPTGQQATGENLRNYTNILHQLGVAYLSQRNPGKARHYYQRALEIKIEYGERYAQASTYYCLGTLAAEQEDYAEAREKWQTALEIYVEYKDEYWAAIAREALEQLPE
jgi:tetratricopeptide (TPR) repeat protein